MVTARLNLPAFLMENLMRRALALAALLALPGLSSSAMALESFSASYTADFQPVPVSGTAERSLQKNSDGSWHLQFRASMLVAGLSEDSQFRYEKQHFQPLSYQFNRSGLGKSKQINLQFDWTAQQITGTDRDKPLRLPLKAGVLDKSTYQLALQQDVAAGKTSMSYQVMDGRGIDTYDFRVQGKEQVQIATGQVEAIKVERVRDPAKSSRQTTLWFAPQWDYLLVRLHQTETDGKEYRIMLQQGQVNGKPVQGR